MNYDEAGDVSASPSTGGDDDGAGLLGPDYRALTVGLAGSVTVVAFLWLGVTTVLPSIAAELDGLSLYGWAFTGFMLAAVAGIATGTRTLTARSASSATVSVDLP